MFEWLVFVWAFIHNLDDPLVISLFAAIGGGCGAAMRRIDGAKEGASVIKTLVNMFVGGTITAITSGAAAMIGIELAPRFPKTVLGAIILSSGIIDTTTDDGKSWIKRELFGRALLIFDAAKGIKPQQQSQESQQQAKQSAVLPEKPVAKQEPKPEEPKKKGGWG